MRKIQSIDDVLCLNDEDFIDYAYRYTLDREADKEGKAYYLSGLRENRFAKFYRRKTYSSA